jgi:hypothetical protein
MSKKEHTFKSLHVAHLSHDDAATLFQFTYEIAIPAREHIGTTANAILDKLIADTVTCSAQVNRQRKSALSDTIKELRKTCNNLLSEIKRTIKFNAESRNQKLSEAAMKLKFFFKPNWDLNKKTLGTQMEKTAFLLKEYQANDALRAAALTIGVDALMMELQTANTKLETVYLTRNEEVGSRPPSGTNLRPPTNESYMQFCTAIEHAARYTPNDELNVLRKEAHRFLVGKKNKEILE